MSDPRPVIKLVWQCGPQHDRCTVFCGMSSQILANCGTLTFRADGESLRFRDTIKQGIQGTGFDGMFEANWLHKPEDEE